MPKLGRFITNRIDIVFNNAGYGMFGSDHAKTA